MTTQTTPNKENPWLWYYSDDEEHYYGQLDSREDAIKEGKETFDGDFYIMEAVKGDYDLHIPEWRFFEWMDAQNEEQINPEGDGLAASFTKEQADDLIKSINSAIDAWKERTKIHLEPWGFSGTRNSEKVENKDVTA